MMVQGQTAGTMAELLNRVDLLLKTEGETAALGRWLAPVLRSGDTVLLSGPVGAGKTHFVRALLQKRLGETVDIPSPTFALVQPYDDKGLAILHADLYRVIHADEVMELGLEEAMAAGIALIEWPEKLGVYRPADALELTFLPLADARHLTAQGSARLVNRVAAFSEHRARND